MQDKHAVVLGASMGGLLAARVLADRFARVTVLERDELPDEPQPRRGVPQSKHGHTLLPRGSKIIGELFPGLLDELVADGVPVIDDDYGELHFEVNGHRVNASGVNPSDFQAIYTPSRPLLEYRVRSHLDRLSNVDIKDGRVVAGLRSENGAVTGVDTDAGPIDADLVVDCMGRGGRAPAWLEELGYERPREDEVDVGVSYATLKARLQPGDLPEKMVVIGPAPEHPDAVLIFQHEQLTCDVVAAGFGGRKPPTEFGALVEYAAARAPEHMVRALRNAEQLAPIVQHQFHASRWRRYDKLRRFPPGLLVFGDAFCSFNPAYGQGMSMAAVQAQALQRCLESDVDSLAERFFRAAASEIGPVWTFDARNDEATNNSLDGRLSTLQRVIGAGFEQYFAALSTDGELGRRFLQVAGLMEPPSRLFPATAPLRVLWSSMSRSDNPEPPPINSARRSIVDARGVQFHVTESGSGTPVLALHGWPQHHYEYRSLLANPPQGLRIIAPDLPGYGWSSAPPHNWSKDEIVEDVLALMDAMELDRVLLVGHDWGGWIGHLLTLRAPERFAGYLALSIPHPWTPPATLLKHAWRMAHMPVNASVGYLLHRHTSWVRQMLRLGGVPVAEVDVFADRFRDPTSAKAGTDTYRTFLLREIPASARRPERRRSTVPTRAVIGRRDIIHPDLAAAEDAKADDYTLEIVDGVGHFLVDERPDLVRERLVELATAVGPIRTAAASPERPSDLRG